MERLVSMQKIHPGIILDGSALDAMHVLNTESESEIKRAHSSHPAGNRLENVVL